MIPQLYLNTNPDSIDQYINQIISQRGMSPHHQYVIQPSPNSIGIEQIRTIREEVLLTGARGWIISFRSFEKATVEAQNALLKLFEDWGEVHQFILFANRKEDILPTIISRCQILTPEPTVAQLEEGLQGLCAEYFAQNRVLVLSHPSVQATTSQRAQEIILEVISFYRTMIRSGKLAHSAKIQKAMELLGKTINNNLSPQLSVDLVLLDMVQSS